MLFLFLVLLQLAQGKSLSQSIPSLQQLLSRAGWSIPPELSGAFRPGDVYKIGPDGLHRLQLDGCIEAERRASSYTSISVVSQLQAGVLLSAGMHAGLQRKLRFGRPEHVQIPQLDMQLSAGCVQKIREAAQQGENLSRWYVIREALYAEVDEQICGSLSLRGRFAFELEPIRGEFGIKSGSIQGRFGFDSGLIRG